MSETIMNLYPIFKFFVIILALFGGHILFNNISNLAARAFKDKLDIMQEILNKYPLVSAEFMKKSEKMMNIENNQEIHELYKKVAVIEKKLEGIEIK
jgi:hypothetical protein